MAAGEPPTGSPSEGAFPVFRGFEVSSVSGKDIAAIAGVSAPTVSKWRTGRLRVPADTLAFLTLVLASWLEDLDQAAGARDRGRADSARRALHLQESFNATLPPRAIREGALRFRAWWQRTHGAGMACRSGQTREAAA